MDFKKPNRHHGGSAAPNTQQRSTPASIDSRPVWRPTPAQPVRKRAPPVPTTPKAFLTVDPPKPRTAPSAIPATKKPKPRIKLALTKKTRVIIIAGIIIVVLALGVVLINARQATLSSSPQYITLLPGDKSIEELGGWKRISPPKNDPVFAYTDVIDGVPINVSEQPLPKSFLSDVDNQVTEVAKKFNADTKVSAGSTTVYIGTSVKGPQSVIFSKRNLLVLIKSEKVVSTKSWTDYVSSLQ